MVEFIEERYIFYLRYVLKIKKLKYQLQISKLYICKGYIQYLL